MPTVKDDRDRSYEKDPDEWTKEDIRIGMQQALAGEGRPAREVLEELRRELDDEDESQERNLMTNFEPIKIECIDVDRSRRSDDEKTFTFVFRLKSPPKQEWAALMLNMWDEPHPRIGEKVPVDVDCEEGTITSIFPLPAASHRAEVPMANHAEEMESAVREINSQYQSVVVPRLARQEKDKAWLRKINETRFKYDDGAEE